MANRLLLFIWWLCFVQISLAFKENQSDVSASFEQKLDNINNECIPPPVLSEFYDKQSNRLDMKAVYEFYMALRSQVHLRYGKSQLLKALNGYRSKVKFDELDKAYFLTRNFFNCQRSNKQ